MRLAVGHIVQHHILRLKDDRHVFACRRLEQIVHHFLLAIDRDPAAAGARRHIDAEHLPVADQIGAVMKKALRPQPAIQPEPRHHIDGDLLQHAGADPAFDIGAIPPLQHRRGDAVKAQQMRQKKSCRPCANDRDLGAHGTSFFATLGREGVF